MSVDNRERAQKAVQLKIAGATWDQIAGEIGYNSESGARDLVTRYFDSHAKEQFAQMHPILLERGEALWRKAWTKLNQLQANGAPIDDWDKAMKQCVSVANYLAKISGYGDGPKVQINVQSTADVKRLRDEFLSLRGSNPTTIDGNVENIV